jgi:3-hydroxyisobutyrate dehydrogenase
MPSIAVLGTGAMGAPMARNLARAGHDVRAWNRTLEKAAPLRDDGVDVRDDTAAAADGADVVMTMLADADAVLAVAEQANLRDGQIWWQASTIGIDGNERCAALAAETAAALVDAPVLGTRQPAEEGKLTVLASGPGRERLSEVFEAVAAKVIDLGDEVGAATRMKLVGNSWVLALVEGLAETIALAEELGIDPRKFLEMIDGGPMFAPYAKLKGEAMIKREFPPSFPLALAAKDAGLITEAAPDLPLPKLVREQMLKAAEAGHGEEDMAATFLALSS